MSENILCFKCNSPHVYQFENMNICPECANEWSINDSDNNLEEESLSIKDTNGNELKEGDQVTLIKDLKLKGSSSILKMGTKVKISRFLDGDHNIDCKIDGIGAMMLKSEFVQKVNK